MICAEKQGHIPKIIIKCINIFIMSNRSALNLYVRIWKEKLYIEGNYSGTLKLWIDKKGAGVWI